MFIVATASFQARIPRIFGMGKPFTQGTRIFSAYVFELVVLLCTMYFLDRITNVLLN